MLHRNVENFIGCDSSYRTASIVLYGAPFDSTTSYRPGARFGPAAMRHESYGLETYSPYQDKDLTDGNVFDSGDLELCFGSSESALVDIESRAAEILRDGKLPLLLGGEHLVTLGAVRAAATAVAGSNAFLANACCAAVGAHVHAEFLLVLGRLRIGAGRKFRIGWAGFCGFGGRAGGGAIACVVARAVVALIGEVGARGVGPVWFVSGVPNPIIPVNARETIDSPCFAGGFYVRQGIRLVPRLCGGPSLSAVSTTTVDGGSTVRRCVAGRRAGARVRRCGRGRAR